MSAAKVMGEPVHVLVVDDHAIVRTGLTYLLKTIFPAVAITEAEDGETAMQQCLSEAWELVILDITLPKQNGIEVLRQVKRQRPELRIIMLSMHSGPEYVLHCLRLGAAGYLVKESATEELEPAIHAVLKGETYISQGLAERLYGKRQDSS
jgi:DNA-binding NarL/FixJ family response regulator